ncbi:MAG: glycerol acyltransferase [Blastopirellula sp.]|nr:glycerol acyltransferase [Blastopirellula sp.]
MSYRWVKWSRGYRRRKLLKHQQLTSITCENSDVLRDAVASGHGVLLAPNHSAHYDSQALYVAADRLDIPLYYLTAWQVFFMSTAFECTLMQRIGAFSIDRESTDRRAFKQSIEILQGAPYPLVIFPEGDIYHTTDVVSPFREGAAAIALTAAKKADRPMVVIPCGIKFFYVDDPMEKLHAITSELEARLFLRSDPNRSLVDRIHRLAESALALKELDYLGFTRSGRLRDRVVQLTDEVLRELETRHGVEADDGSPPERVKVLRQKVIQELERDEDALPTTSEEYRRLTAEMGDLFLATQLYSYRGDYLADDPSIERLAETLDKFEEDILERDLPSVRGSRCVKIRFGDAIPVAAGERRGRGAVADLTAEMQGAVQQQIDLLNADHASAPKESSA